MIGVVVALALEAKSFGRKAPRGRGEIVQHSERLICVSGVGARAATEAAHALVSRGASALVSFGTAGALDPTVSAGTLLLPASVVTVDGDLPLDRDWRDRLSTCRDDRTPICMAPLAEAREVLTTVEAKRRAFAQTGAAAVDMESAAVAAIAQECRLPCVCIRAISDAADVPLPELVRVAVDSQGRIRLGAAMKALLRRPQEVGHSIRLLLGFRKAQVTLARIVHRAGPRLQGPPRSTLSRKGES